jgi:hypothetical protein
MKVSAFWDILSCSFVEVHGRFRGANYFIMAMSEAVPTSETSKLHGAISEKAVIFILAVIRNRNLKYNVRRVSYVF